MSRAPLLRAHRFTGPVFLKGRGGIMFASSLYSFVPEPVIAESLRKPGAKTTVYPGLRSKLSYAALRVMTGKLVTVAA